MRMEFFIQQMKLCVIFDSSVNEIAFGLHFLIAWEWNAAPILILTDSTSHELHDTQPDFAYLRSQYFQWRAPFKFLQFLIISRRQGRKMALTSLNVYTTSHPLLQSHYTFRTIGYRSEFLEAPIPLVRWKVNLRWPSTGCHQIQTTQWLVWIWFYWDWWT